MGAIGSVLALSVQLRGPGDKTDDSTVLGCFSTKSPVFDTFPGIRMSVIGVPGSKTATGG